MSAQIPRLAHRHSVASANQAFAERGLELREQHYRNSQTLMAYVCHTCGYEGMLRLGDALNGVGCRKCGIKKRFEKHRIDFSGMTHQLRARGIEVLSPDCMYRTSPARVRCKKCRKEWETKAGSLLDGTGCNRCRLRELARGQRYTTTQARHFLAKMDIVLLTEYVNSQTPIRVRFKACDHEALKTWNQIQGGERCPKCARNARFTMEDYAEAAKKHGGSISTIY